MIKIVFIDFSRTLVKGSGANSGAEFLGKGDIYRQLYPKYISGEIEIKELLIKTFACWEGLKTSDLSKVYEQFELNEGVRETIKILKEKGIKIMLLTPVPTHIIKFFQDDLGLDFISGTVLEVKEDIFTGKILHHFNKLFDAIELLKKENISPDEAISIGDRKDDAKVFEKVKFGIAYNGDENSKKAAKYQITEFKEIIDIIEKESN